jgi:hypothetical protein
MGVACAGIDSNVLTDLLEEAISPVSRDEEYDSEEIAYLQKEVFDRVKTMHGVDQNVAVKDLLKMCGTEIDLVKKKIAKYGISEDQTIESAVVKDVLKFYDIARTVTNDEKAKYFGGKCRSFPLIYYSFWYLFQSDPLAEHDFDWIEISLDGAKFDDCFTCL